jgi:lipoprotein NlpI
MNRQQDFSHLNKEQKLNLLKQLVKMAKADKVFKFVEFKYLTEIAELLNVTATQLDDILDNEIVAPIPEKMIDRTRQIYRLTVMMMIDHIITKEEMVLLKNFAVEMGLQPNSIEVMIERMNQNKGGMLLDTDLCEIFSITLN